MNLSFDLLGRVLQHHNLSDEERETVIEYITVLNQLDTRLVSEGTELRGLKLFARIYYNPKLRAALRHYMHRSA